jgi:hypothetical protein
VFLEDAFEDGGGAGVVPDALGVDDGDGAGHADAQAADLAAQDAACAAQLQFAQPLLEERPGFIAGFLGATFVLAGIGAQEDVPLRRNRPAWTGSVRRG